MQTNPPKQPNQPRIYPAMTSWCEWLMAHPRGAKLTTKIGEEWEINLHNLTKMEGPIGVTYAKGDTFEVVMEMLAQLGLEEARTLLTTLKRNGTR